MKITCLPFVLPSLASLSWRRRLVLLLLFFIQCQGWLRSRYLISRSTYTSRLRRYIAAIIPPSDYAWYSLVASGSHPIMRLFPGWVVTRSVTFPLYNSTIPSLLPRPRPRPSCLYQLHQPSAKLEHIDSRFSCTYSRWIKSKRSSQGRERIKQRQ